MCEAMYIKSRALAKLERYTEADETNCQLANVFEMATPDAKVLFMIAMLNEMHIGDPGLDLMRKLVEARPKYDLGILALRTLMQCHNLKLDKQSDNNCELVDLFNSDATEEEFLAQLKVCREKAPKAIAYLIRRIKKQEFNEEEPAHKAGGSSKQTKPEKDEDKNCKTERHRASGVPYCESCIQGKGWKCVLSVCPWSCRLLHLTRRSMKVPTC